MSIEHAIQWQMTFRTGTRFMLMNRAIDKQGDCNGLFCWKTNNWFDQILIKIL